MSGMRLIYVLVQATAALVFAAQAAAVEPTTGAAMPAVYKKCANLNAKYPHGLGRANAVDKTTDVRVTTFKRSTKLYNVAMSYNRGLDRDKDGIACEKR